MAVLRGYDVRSEEVRSVVLLTLLGSAGAGVVADLGAQLGTKSAFAALKRLPGRVLIEINKKVGFRLLTKFGTTGVINLGKVIPVAGGVVSAGVNIATMRAAGKFAQHNFPNLAEEPEVAVSPNRTDVGGTRMAAPPPHSSGSSAVSSSVDKR